MPRYKLTIEYDGSTYKGWQRQNDRPSIQQRLEQAITDFVRYPITVFGAGRTDAGVHAFAQVAHIDLQEPWDPFRICNAANAHLKDSGIAVFSAEEVAEDFNARFSATTRHYLYRIITRRAPLTFERGRAWNVKVPLDVEAMHNAAQQLLGLHDFTTFRSTECQAKSPLKSLLGLDVTSLDQIDGQHIEIRALAPSFLHNQVRSLVGSLKCVGDGKWSESDLVAALEACERRRCGPVAPPQGLYLAKVEY